MYCSTMSDLHWISSCQTASSPRLLDNNYWGIWDNHALNLPVEFMVLVVCNLWSPHNRWTYSYLEGINLCMRNKSFLEVSLRITSAERTYLLPQNLMPLYSSGSRSICCFYGVALWHVLIYWLFVKQADCKCLIFAYHQTMLDGIEDLLMVWMSLTSNMPFCHCLHCLKWCQT